MSYPVTPKGVMAMILLRKFRCFAMFVLLLWFFFLPMSYAEENHLKAGGTQDLVLTPADQLILKSIDSLGKELNDRIDNVWITMLGGFLGVMAFIGGIVFWDRRTFMKRAQEECRQEVFSDREKLATMLKAMRKLSERFPDVREVLNSSGLL